MLLGGQAYIRILVDLVQVGLDLAEKLKNH